MLDLMRLIIQRSKRITFPCPPISSIPTMVPKVSRSFYMRTSIRTRVCMHKPLIKKNRITLYTLLYNLILCGEVWWGLGKIA